jgi:Rrf2 family protein
MPLRSAGLIKAVRGVHGGYTLTRPPREIAMAEVFAALEGPPAVVECLKASARCAMSDRCPTRGVWRRMNDAISEILEGTTLADLAGIGRQKGGGKRRSA